MYSIALFAVFLVLILLIAGHSMTRQHVAKLLHKVNCGCYMAFIDAARNGEARDVIMASAVYPRDVYDKTCQQMVYIADKIDVVVYAVDFELKFKLGRLYSSYMYDNRLLVVIRTDSELRSEVVESHIAEISVGEVIYTI